MGSFQRPSTDAQIASVEDAHCDLVGQGASGQRRRSATLHPAGPPSGGRSCAARFRVRDTPGPWWPQWGVAGNRSHRPECDRRMDCLQGKTHRSGSATVGSASCSPGPPASGGGAGLSSPAQPGAVAFPPPNALAGPCVGRPGRRLGLRRLDLDAYRRGGREAKTCAYGRRITRLGRWRFRPATASTPSGATHRRSHRSPGWWRPRRAGHERASGAAPR